MKRLVIATYNFIFDPDANTWSSWSSFERDLADFYAAHGLQADIIETAGNGTKAIYIQKIDDPLDKLRKASDQPQKNPKQALETAMSKATAVGGKKNGKA